MMAAAASRAGGRTAARQNPKHTVSPIAGCTASPANILHKGSKAGWPSPALPLVLWLSVAGCVEPRQAACHAVHQLNQSHSLSLAKQRLPFCAYSRHFLPRPRPLPRPAPLPRPPPLPRAAPPPRPRPPRPPPRLPPPLAVEPSFNLMSSPLCFMALSCGGRQTEGGR